MASIRTQIELVDNLSAPLFNISSSLESTSTAMEDMNSAMNSSFDSSQFDDARSSIDSTNDELDDMTRNIRENENAQEQFNEEVNRGANNVENLGSKIMGVVAALGAGLMVKRLSSNLYEAAAELEATEAKYRTVFNGMTDISDEFISDFQKLTPATVAEARSMSSGIQDLLVPMGFARDAATEMTGETMHLVGALTNFNSATKSAEDVSGAFQSALTGQYESLKALGIQVNDTIVREHAVAMGLAETTKEVDNAAKAQALLELAYEQSGDALEAYNEESLDTATRMKLLQAGFQDTFAEAGQILLPRINELLSQVQDYMPQITAMVHGFAAGLAVGVEVTSWLLDGVMSVYNFMAENWSYIEPMIMGIVAAMIIYLGYLTLMNAVQLISNGIKIAAAIASYAYAAATGTQASATAAATVAQTGLNAAMLASPVTWIIIMIIALIAVFYGAIAALNHFAGTSISATGIVAGVFAALGAYLFNIIAYIWNLFASIAEFFANVFTNPVYSVRRLFGNLTNNVLDMAISITSGFDSVATNIANAFVSGANMAVSSINWIISAINKIPGVDIGEIGTMGQVDSITSSLNNLKTSVDDWVGDEPDNYWTAPTMEMKEIGGAFDAGYSVGEGIGDSVKNFSLGSLFDTDVPGADQFANEMNVEEISGLENIEGLDDFGGLDDVGGLGGSGGGSAYDKVPGDISDTAENTADIKNALDFTNEELKYLRDLAEQEVVNRFTTAEVKVEMTNNNNISSEMDLDGVVDYLATGIEEAMEITAEGVHE